MFDPSVSDPLVLEHGPDDYHVAAPVDSIMQITIYEDIAAKCFSWYVFPIVYRHFTCARVWECAHAYMSTYMLCHTVDWATGMASGMEETECWCIGGRDMLCGERFASLVVI